MRRERLRPAWPAQKLAELYAQPHDHLRWGDHILRVDMTIAAGLELAAGGIESAADLSCGNGSILAAMLAERKLYGDLAQGWEFTGPIEATIEQIEPVDMFICTETIEHLDDPDTVLKAIGGKARMLLLSTPINAWDDGNLEHYWAFDREAVEAMAVAAGYTLATFRELHPSYHWGIWGWKR